jgi:hypothetical protein
MHKIRSFLSPAAILAILLALVTSFWAPTLFDDKVLAHGDSVLHGLSLWEYYAQNIDQPGNLLWSRDTFGGHPLYAESQAAFAFPVNALLVHIVTPMYANSFAHWLQMLLAGIAVYGLSRTLRLSTWASGFAVLGTVFSSYWLQMQENMTVGATAMCVPWFLWAAESWFQRPGWKSAMLFGMAAAITVFAGYPHHLQGAAVYMVVSLLPNLLERRARTVLIARSGLLLKTGLVAVTIGTGVAAVQLLPLIELTQFSHRSAGAYPVAFELPLDNYIRGLLYHLSGSEFDPEKYVSSIGSFIVVLAFTLTILFKLPTRIRGHFYATLLLLNLAIGGTSPLTAFLYNFHLIPGMHYFRVMIPYFIVASVGVAIVAGYSIDRLTSALKEHGRDCLRTYFVSQREKFAAASFVSFWIFCLYRVGVPFPAGTMNAAFSGLALLVVFVLAAVNRASLIPMALFFVLASEIASLKLDEYVFVASSVLRKPETANVINQQDPGRNYKFYSGSLAPRLYMLAHPQHNTLANQAEAVQSHLVGLSNLRWKIPAMTGATALQLRESAFLNDILDEETRGISRAPLGMRLMDIFGVKYIAADGPTAGPGFNLKFQHSETNTWLIENTAAKPRFQVYTNYRFVNDPQEALDALQSTKIPLLVLQETDYMSPKSKVELAPSSSVERPDITFSLTKDTFTHYELRTKATKPGWLFLADSNYPGWHGYIDGREVPVYTAQVAGKAIYVPAGDHDVTLSFKSSSFRLGLWLTTATFMVVSLIGLLSIARRARLSRFESMNEKV